MASEEKTKCKACGCEIVQVSGGHRQREYCDDACKHVALRRRQEDQRKEEIRQRWAGFTSETQTYLDWLMSRYGEDHAQGVATTIKRELGQAQHSPIEEQNIRHMEQYAIDCSLSAGQAKERIAALEQELAKYRQVLDLSDREKLEMQLLTLGEALKYDRLINGQILIDPGLAVWMGYARSARDETLARAVVAAGYLYKHKEALGMLPQEQERQERAAGQEDHQNIETYQEKLAQASQRISKLEGQVDIQRQRLGQYYQRFYPSSLAVAAQRLMALGAALNYKLLLKYDSQAIGIRSGEDAWREFATHASYEDVAQAILQAQHFFDNLQALGMLGKRDAPGGQD